MMKTHGWETASKSNDKHTCAPPRMDVLNQLSNHTDGPHEGTKEHVELQSKMKLSHRTSPDEMTFACVGCRPDIGHAVTLMSKCGQNPTEFHCSCLKSTARCLRAAKHWGITFHGIGDAPPDPPDEPIPEILKSTQELPKHPTDTIEPKPVCFVDAACRNDPIKQRSTAGHAVTHCGVAMLHQSKAQSITALSSAKAELIATVTAAGENIKHTRSVLTELGIPELAPAPTREDNKLAVEIANANEPTGRS